MSHPYRLVLEVNDPDNWVIVRATLTPIYESPFPGALLAMMSTTTNRDTLQYESMGVKHDRT